MQQRISLGFHSFLRTAVICGHSPGHAPQFMEPPERALCTLLSMCANGLPLKHCMHHALVNETLGNGLRSPSVCGHAVHDIIFWACTGFRQALFHPILLILAVRNRKKIPEDESGAAEGQGDG